MVSSFFLGLFLLGAAAALPQGVYVGPDGSVGASFGGYHASAGLGGILSGAGPRGGLHAQAGTPGGHFAAAGLGGSVSEGAGPQGQLYSAAGHAPSTQLQPVGVAYPAAQPAAPASSNAHSKASASASSNSGGAGVPAAGSNSQASASSSAASGSAGPGFQGGAAPVYVQKRPGTFFDDIFNIPISTLGAVNQYLNNRQRVAAVPAGVVQEPAKDSSSSFASSSASSSSSASASASADAGSPGAIDNNIYHGVVYKKTPNYNDIFNIPISVLGAVNRFLNG